MISVVCSHRFQKRRSVFFGFFSKHWRRLKVTDGGGTSCPWADLFKMMDFLEDLEGNQEICEAKREHDANMWNDIDIEGAHVSPVKQRFHILPGWMKRPLDMYLDEFLAMNSAVRFPSEEEFFPTCPQSRSLVKGEGDTPQKSDYFLKLESIPLGKGEKFESWKLPIF